MRRKVGPVVACFGHILPDLLPIFRSRGLGLGAQVVEVVAFAPPRELAEAPPCACSTTFANRGGIVAEAGLARLVGLWHRQQRTPEGQATS